MTAVQLRAALARMRRIARLSAASARRRGRIRGDAPSRVGLMDVEVALLCATRAAELRRQLRALGELDP